MKPIGATKKERHGDWVYTMEVVGYNEKIPCNIWAEKKREYDPHPYLRDIIASIERDRDMEYTKNLRRRIAL